MDTLLEYTAPGSVLGFPSQLYYAQHLFSQCFRMEWTLRVKGLLAYGQDSLR